MEEPEETHGGNWAGRTEKHEIQADYFMARSRKISGIARENQHKLAAGNFGGNRDPVNCAGCCGIGVEPFRLNGSTQDERVS